MTTISKRLAVFAVLFLVWSSFSLADVSAPQSLGDKRFPTCSETTGKCVCRSPDECFDMVESGSCKVIDGGQGSSDWTDVISCSQNGLCSCDFIGSSTFSGAGDRRPAPRPKPALETVNDGSSNTIVHREIASGTKSETVSTRRGTAPTEDAAPDEETEGEPNKRKVRDQRK